MKDFTDVQTTDLFLKPRPGRPVTGNAKSKAQIQREVRARRAEEGTRNYLLTRSERVLLIVSLRACPGADPVMIAKLAQRLE